MTPGRTGMNRVGTACPHTTPLSRTGARKAARHTECLESSPKILVHPGRDDGNRRMHWMFNDAASTQHRAECPSVFICGQKIWIQRRIFRQNLCVFASSLFKIRIYEIHLFFVSGANAAGSGSMCHGGSENSGRASDRHHGREQWWAKFES